MNDAVFQKLALMGKAEWMTINHAGFDAATIKVPDNGFLLLRQIIYHHFCDQSKVAGEAKDLLDNTVHCLSLNELGDNSELPYVFRSAITPVYDPDAALWFSAVTAPPTIIDTWKVFRKPMCIDLWRVPPVSEWVPVSGKFTKQAEERILPLGFGNDTAGVDVIASLTSANIGKYYPNGENRVIAGTNPSAAGAGFRTQFRPPINAANRLHSAAGKTYQSAQNVAPFITFGFWKFTGDPAEIAKFF